jgi:hypothetical protein
VLTVDRRGAGRDFAKGRGLTCVFPVFSPVKDKGIAPLSLLRTAAPCSSPLPCSHQRPPPQAPQPSASRVFKGQQVAATLLTGSPKAPIRFTCVQGEARAFKGMHAYSRGLFPANVRDALFDLESFTAGHFFLQRRNPPCFWGPQIVV